jgi:imidazolonepropionase-like amidohydrolase
MEDAMVRDADIFLSQGKICHIGTGLSANGGAVIDCEGKFIIPSLFDMHVHLNVSAMLDLFIANGVTCVRNMWGFPLQLEWKKRIEEGSLTGPYIYSTGPLTDGVTYWDGSQIVTTEREAENAVLKNHADGYLFFKTYPNIPKDAYLKILETAKRIGFPVCGHGSNFLSWKTLADFGYYCCEHTNCLPDDFSDVDYMAKSGMWLCLTHTVEQSIADYVYGSASFDTLPWYDYLSEREKKEWEKITRWRKTNGRYSLNESFPMEKILEKTHRFIALAGKDKVLLGTDTNNPGVGAGFTIHDELRHLTELFGFSEFEAIQAGTVNAAAHLKLEKQKGKILEGFDADILVLNGNPLENIARTRDIEAVIQGGKIYDRAGLDTILASVKSRKNSDIIYIEDTPDGNSA